VIPASGAAARELAALDNTQWNSPPLKGGVKCVRRDVVRAFSRAIRVTYFSRNRKSGRPDPWPSSGPGDDGSLEKRWHAEDAEGAESAERAI